jgi:hypothetical protein
MGIWRESKTRSTDAARMNNADGTIAKKISSKNMVKSKSSLHPDTVGPNAPSALVEHCVSIVTLCSKWWQCNRERWKVFSEQRPPVLVFVGALSSQLSVTGTDSVSLGEELVADNICAAAATAARKRVEAVAYSITLVLSFEAAKSVMAMPSHVHIQRESLCGNKPMC